MNSRDGYGLYKDGTAAKAFYVRVDDYNETRSMTSSRFSATEESSKDSHNLNVDGSEAKEEAR